MESTRTSINESLSEKQAPNIITQLWIVLDGSQIALMVDMITEVVLSLHTQFIEFVPVSAD